MMDLFFLLKRDGMVVGFEKHMYLENPMTKDKNSIRIYHSKTGHELSWKDVSMNDDEKSYILHDNKMLIAEDDIKTYA